MDKPKPFAKIISELKPVAIIQIQDQKPSQPQATKASVTPLLKKKALIKPIKNTPEKPGKSKPQKPRGNISLDKYI